MLCFSTRVKRIMINHNVSRHVSSATPQIFISFMKNLNSQKSARNNIIKTYKKKSLTSCIHAYLVMHRRNSKINSQNKIIY